MHRLRFIRQGIGPLNINSNLVRRASVHTTPTTMVNKIPSKLARETSKSIWVEFTALAAEHKAVNLGQGFPDCPMPDFMGELLADVAHHPDRTDWHQYTRGFGHPDLVRVLADFYTHLLGTPVNANEDVLVTVGAYLALYYTMLGWLNPGDEVILFEPAYDSYIPQAKMAGAVPVPICLDLQPNAQTSADYHLDLAKLRAKVSPRTKLIVLNNPNNPTGKLFTRAELEGIADVAREHDLIVLADEVYEWHVYPGGEMIRFASLPGMYERTITVGSAGKAFSATGWKLGWALGPAALLAPLRAIHQNCVFACSTPTQEAVARAFRRELRLLEAGNRADSYLHTGMAAQLRPKRDRLAAKLRQAGMNPILPQASYFMLADVGHVDGPFREGTEDELDFRFVRWLIKEKGLATIPPSAFFSPEHKKGNDHFVRLCFFKKDETLDAAIQILDQFAKK